MSDTPSRKLAVILHADVVGSTHLGHLNETLAHQRIHDAFLRFSRTIESYGGIAREIRGDALVAEFSRASDAVCAAMAFQEKNSKVNASLDDDIRPGLRIGIAMGEVVIGNNTITGDGVVLAQRLEQLAENGQACIHGAAYETVPKRLPFHYENLGERALKGFEEGVRAYSVSLIQGATVPPSEYSPHRENRTLQAPDKRSLAVLPFINMSGDPEQEYFADGITEDIITDVSKISGLFVIARNSSFSFKNQSVDIKEVGIRLGVRHVLEGSVRKVGNKVRINVQLIDAESGGHVWAERYDRDLEDIFVLQDEVTRRVVETLKVTLTGGEQARREERGKVNTQAYDYFIRARSCLQQFNEESLVEARAMLDRALAIDAGLTQIYGYQAIVYAVEYLNSWNNPSADHLEQALALARKGCKANEFDAISHNALALCLMWLRKLDEAERAARQTLAIDPNFAEGHGGLGNVLHFSGKHALSIESFEQALRLDPEFHIWIHALGRAQFALKRYDEAESTFERRLIHMPRSDVTRAYLASLYGHTGRHEEARTIWRELMEINPKYSVEHSRRILPYRDPAPMEEFIEGLRKAGLTD